MKFLQEMIAKKRAQQDDEELYEDDEVKASAQPGDGFVQSDLPHAVSPDALHMKPAARVPAQDAWQEEGYEDDEDLFDDGSYDWDLEDDEEEEVAAEQEDNLHPFERPNPTAAEADYDDDEEADMSAATSMVLKDIVARSQANTPAPEPTPAPAPAAESEPQLSLEQSVQKLRVQRKIWDMDSEDDDIVEAQATSPKAVPEPQPEPVSAPEPMRAEAPVQPPAPVAEAPAETPAAPAPAPQTRRGGRVKTRLLGFQKPEDTVPDPVASQALAATAPGEPQFPVGWMVVMKGPGRGACFTLTAGASKIGRGEDQAIRLDFGDNSISRDNHAAVAFDSEQRSFFIGHGGKANLVRLNDMPVLSTEPLVDGDEIRIGETTLRLVAFCGPDFSWDDEDGDGDGRYAAAE